VSWGSSTGAELDARPLLALPAIPCALRYPAAHSLPDGILYAPPSMDFKWVLALREGRLLAARSWTGTVEAVATAQREGDELVVGPLRVAEASALRLCTNLVDVFDWLIRVHVWDQRLPLPVDEAAANALEREPLVGFSRFGKALFCAARSWRPPSPPRPLRADGEVMLAARKGDVSALERAVKAGADVDAPGARRGYTALHVAVIRGDTQMVRRLLEMGANAGARADRGNHALGLAVVHKASGPIFDALAGTHMDLGQANADGFTALHAAAEVDHPTVVPWLVAHGLALEARTRHGHTPLHVAAALGHVATAKALLDAGADVYASSPGGTPLDVARAEEKQDTAALLSAYPQHS
jgi:Ankyrin repeats (3 copies)/Ankyrin repeat